MFEMNNKSFFRVVNNEKKILKVNTRQANNQGTWILEVFFRECRKEEEFCARNRWKSHVGLLWTYWAMIRMIWDGEGFEISFVFYRFFGFINVGHQKCLQNWWKISFDFLLISLSQILRGFRRTKGLPWPYLHSFLQYFPCQIFTFNLLFGISSLFFRRIVATCCS